MQSIEEKRHKLIINHEGDIRIGGEILRKDRAIILITHLLSTKGDFTPTMVGKDLEWKFGITNTCRVASSALKTLWHVGVLKKVLVSENNTDARRAIYRLNAESDTLQLLVKLYGIHLNDGAKGGT